MKWINSNPNIMVLIAWIIGSILVAVSVASASGNLYLLSFAFIIVICALGWSLKIKQHSLFNLFYLLIPFIGFIIVWATENNSKKTIEDLTSISTENSQDQQ